MSHQRGWGEAPIGSGAPFPADHVRAGAVLVEASAAQRQARACYWRGIIEGAAWTLVLIGGSALGVSMAFALDISGSTVTVQPTDEPGAVAEVVFDNQLHNSWADDGDYVAAMPGLSVGVRFAWEVNPFGSDAVTITPPDGLICDPASCRIEAMEGFTGRLILRDFLGM